MTNKVYNVLIVDDEFLARKLLKDYVMKVDVLNLVATCSNVVEATEALRNNKVDIMLLDIQMPDSTGLELLQSMDRKPVVIFTTAYSEYAVDAFNMGVTDYLLKPFGFPRFLQAINKAIGMAQGEGDDGQTRAKVSKSNEFLMVKADYKYYKINYDDLLYIEGQHEYVTFHTKERRITALFALKDLVDLLPPDRFMRIHKSYIISLAAIQDLDKSDVTVAGTPIPIGGNYRDDLLERLKIG